MTPSTNNSKGSQTSPSKRSQILEQKNEFYDICLQNEGTRLQELAYSVMGNYSNFSTRPEREEVLLARKEHQCNVQPCTKLIKKGSMYFRRSFGQVWTIKACSMECFCRGLP